MPNEDNASFSMLKQRLLDGMIEYMRGDPEQPDEDWDCGYTQQEIDRCAAIVDEYLATISPDRRLTQDEIRAAVKKAVCDLNQLNDSCGGALIETDQREDLCELILGAAQHAGLDTDEDITEQWREW